MIPIGEGSRAPIFPIVTYAIIAANVYVFFREFSAPNPDAFINAFAAIPYDVTHDIVLRPPSPPFPVPRNLPFQLAAAGSQSSIRMSESLEGVSVACTRQNAGRSLKFAGPRPPAGATNDPALTVCAIVIFVFGSESDDRLSHVAALETAGANAVIDASTRIRAVMMRRI